MHHSHAIYRIFPTIAYEIDGMIRKVVVWLGVYYIYYMINTNNTNSNTKISSFRQKINMLLKRLGIWLI